MKNNTISWMSYITQAGVSLGLAKEVVVEFPEWGNPFAVALSTICSNASSWLTSNRKAISFNDLNDPTIVTRSPASSRVKSCGINRTPRRLTDIIMVSKGSRRSLKARPNRFGFFILKSTISWFLCIPINNDAAAGDRTK